MKTIIFFMALFLVLILGANLMYAGAGNRTGTGGASQLQIPVGVRGIALGGQGVSSSTGIEALYWNPAGISNMRSSTEVTFSHMNHIADIGVEYGAVASKFEGFGTIAINIKSLSVGDIPVTTTLEPDGNGTTYSPQFLTAGLSFSRQLSDRVSVGLTATYITEAMGNVNASGLAFDVGVLYDNLVDLSGLSFGIVIKNLGPQMKYGGSALFVQADVAEFGRPPQYYNINTAGFDLPTFFQLGFSYKPQIGEMNSLLTTASFQNNNFSDDEYRFGLEYGYNNTFFVRGGYSFAPQALEDNYIYGLTAGAGINYQFEGVDLKVDYAFRDVKYFEANHILSIGVGF